MTPEPLSDHFTAIQRVLAAYRSTEAHITSEQITDAWTALEALRDARRLADRVTIVGDEWPIAVSDGVGMPCSDCGLTPYIDYRVTDEFWRQHVPEKPARLSVVCLSCLDQRCGGVGLAEALVFAQWTGTGHTVHMVPTARYVYGGAALDEEQHGTR